MPTPAVIRLLTEHFTQKSQSPTTLLDWQLALGQVTRQLPPTNNAIFDPWQKSQQSSLSLPDELRQAWGRRFDATAQVELAPRNERFWRAHTHTIVQSSVHDRWWTRPELNDAPAFISEFSRTNEPCLVTTSGPWLEAPSVAAFGVEDNALQPWPEGSADLQWRPIKVESELRVYEVDSAQAWSDLVEMYPNLFVDGSQSAQGSYGLAHWFAGHRFYEPYWPRVAQDFDVVHLTQLAYVESAYSPLPVFDGFTTISGWGPDVAMWLRNPSGLVLRR